MPLPSRAGRWSDRASIALLLAACVVPLVGTWAGLDLMPQGNDMRHRAELPGVPRTLHQLREWPGAFEAFVGDNFGFRGPLIRGLSRLKVQVLGASSSGNVVLGRDGWLYYNHMQVGSDYDEVRPFRRRELEHWRQVLEHRQEWLRQRGCRYVLLLPPDKQTIYPEHCDPSLRPRHASGRLDQLVAYLREHSPGLTVLDLRREMLEAKQRGQVYLTTDSHWNGEGAFLGYQALARQLAVWFPQVCPFERSQFEATDTAVGGGDLAGLLDMRDAYHDHSLVLHPRFPVLAQVSSRPPELDRRDVGSLGKPRATEHPDSRLPRGLVFHDSFALAVLPLLSEHFQRLAMVWHDDFLPYVAEREKPDVVIQQLLERKLGFVRPTDIGEPVPPAN
jgi:hypothetical protein